MHGLFTLLSILYSAAYGILLMGEFRQAPNAIEFLKKSLANIFLFFIGVGLVTIMFSFDFDVLTHNFLIVVGLFYGIMSIIELSKFEYLNRKYTFKPILLFVLSFLLIMLTGAALLMLPEAHTKNISFTDAFFTSTSATCVTGLVVVDTAKDYTLLGQTIILLLIQVGGLGIMTFTSFFGFFFKKQNTIEEQLNLQSFNNTSLHDARNFVIVVVLVTTLFELFGFFFIYITVPRPENVSFGMHLFFCLFHSISAFCNAGFSTYSDGLYDTSLRFNYNFHLVIALLVILGGLGFNIMNDFRKFLQLNMRRLVFKITGKRRLLEANSKPLTFNDNVVLVTTISLLISGTIIFFTFEHNNTLVEHSSLWGKLVESFFGSVTPRTAGFNTVQIGKMMPATLTIYLLFMWIGASPGSTGGGIKTTTFAVATMNIFAVATGRKRIVYGGRQISTFTVMRAFTIISLSLIVIGLAVTILHHLEHDKTLIELAFEVFSAYSTVGLSMGITAHLTTISKYVIIAIMFIGRVTPLILLMSLFKQVYFERAFYPKADLSLG